MNINTYDNTHYTDAYNDNTPRSPARPDDNTNHNEIIADI